MNKDNTQKLAGIDISAIFTSAKSKEDLKFVFKTLEFLPDDIAATLLKEYVNRWKKNQRSANIWLRNRSNDIRQALNKFPIAIHFLITEIRRVDTAREWADLCLHALHKKTDFGTKTADALETLIDVMAPAKMWGFSPLLPDFSNYEELKEVGEDDHLVTCIAGAIARLTDEAWWLRKINKAWKQYQEHSAIITGKVRLGVSPYVSDKSLREYRQKKEAARKWLESNFAVNEQQDLEILLADAVGGSVSNPTVRRAELMVRMRGFEDLAEEMGFVGEFYTWTTPSRFHAWKKSKKKSNKYQKVKGSDKTKPKKRPLSYANKKYQGTSPRDAQQYLVKQWAKCRAKLAREGIEIFGFRVVEPHHDGTPHWHLLLFINPKQLREARSIMRRYALQHDKHDLAPAKKKRGVNFQSYRPRFDFKTIDPSKGSATGYIAKYIAKNIDGAYVDTDLEAESSGKHGAEGVAAWASLWNIRQFQQIGGPSVSVWRELRRIKSAVKEDQKMEFVRQQADASNWRGFVYLMGGACCPRAERPVQLLKKIEKESNQYGEDIKKIQGVFTHAENVVSIFSGEKVPQHSEVTRLDGWSVSRFGLDALKSGDNRAPWSTDNNCTVLKKLQNKTLNHDDMGFDLGLSQSGVSALLAGGTFIEDGRQAKVINDPVLGKQLIVSDVPSDIKPLDYFSDDDWLDSISCLDEPLPVPEKLTPDNPDYWVSKRHVIDQMAETVDAAIEKSSKEAKSQKKHNKVKQQPIIKKGKDYWLKIWNREK